MTASPPAPDAAALAASVRQLARHAHRTLSDPCPQTSEVEALARRAGALRRQAGSWPQPALARWLDNLERRLSEACEPVAC